MKYSEKDIEQEINDKKLNAPRLSPERIDEVIVEEDYHKLYVSDNRPMIVCVLTLKNGFLVTGINHGPVDPRNWDEELAKKLAYDQARAKVWPLEGYLLADTIYKS